MTHPLAYTEQVHYIASKSLIKVITTSEANELVYLLLNSSRDIFPSCFGLSFPMTVELANALEKAANEVGTDFVSLGYVTRKDDFYALKYFNKSVQNPPLPGEYLTVFISSQNPDVIQLHASDNGWDTPHKFNLSVKDANEIAAALKTAMNDLKEKQQ